MISLKSYRILEYYDVPIVFLAKDSLGQKYLCSIVSDDPVQYLASLVSGSSIYQYISGEVDLREVSRGTDPEHSWHVVAFDDSGELHGIEISDLNIENYLAEEGYYYEPDDEDNLSYSLQTESLSRDKPVVQVAFSPGTDQHKVDVSTFSFLLSSFYELGNSLLVAVARSSGRKFTRTKGLLDLKIFSTAPGSFNARMEVGGDSESFDEPDVEKALKLIHSILSQEDTDDLVAILTRVNGRPISKIRNYLSAVKDADIEVGFSWSSPTMQSVESVRISPIKAESMLFVIDSSSEIKSEAVELMGFVHQADADRGKWRLRTAGAPPKDYHGHSNDNVSLEGIVLTSKLYRFHCQVKHYRTPSNQERTVYVLVRYEDASDHLLDV